MAYVMQKWRDADVNVNVAFALCCQPLAEQRCRVRSHVAPDARHRRCCRHRCHLRVVVVIAALLPPLQLQS